MPQRVKTVHDVGGSQGLLIGNPAEDEARAKESSRRQDAQVRAAFAAQMAAMAAPAGQRGGTPTYGGDISIGKETAQQGSMIANPWMRPDSRPMGVTPGRTVGNNGINNPLADAFARQFAGPSMGVPQAAAPNPSDPRTWKVHDGGGRMTNEQTASAEVEAKKFGLAEKEVLGKHAMGAAQMLQALEEDKRSRSAQSKVAAQATLAPFMEQFTSGNFSDEALKAIEAAVLSDPSLRGGIGEILKDPLFDKKIAENNTMDLSRPAQSLELLVREGAGFGWMPGMGGTFNVGVNPLVDSPAVRKQRAEMILKKLRDLGSAQNDPGATAAETFFRSVMKAFEGKS